MNNENDLVFKTSKWTRRLFNETVQQVGLASEVIEKGSEKQPQFPQFTRELFSRLYSQTEPEKIDIKPEAKWAENAQNEADGLHEFESLMNRSRGDELFSGMATAAISDEILKTLPAAPEEMKQDMNKDRSAIDGMEQLMKSLLEQNANESDIAVLEGELKKSENKLAAAEAAAVEYANSVDPSAIRTAIRKGVAQANERIEEAEQAFESFGCGSSQTKDPRQAGIERLNAWKAVQNNPKIKQISEMAGRLKRIAQQKRRVKSKKEPSEIVGTTKGDDLMWTLPDEMARAFHGERREFLNDLEDKNVQQFRLAGKSKEGKGPLVLCLDGSGSMRGNKEIWSKAVALALLDYAMREKREFVLIQFGNGVERVDRFAKNPDMKEVLSAIDYFANTGSTNIRAGLELALTVIGNDKTFKKADIILISDGIDNTVEGYAHTFKLSTTKIGCIAILIGVTNNGKEAMERLGFDVTTTENIIDAQRQENSLGDKIFTV